MHYRKNIPNKKFLEKNIYSEDDLDTSNEINNNGTKLNEVYLISPKITISERGKKAKEYVAILKLGPKPINTNEMEEDLQSWIISDK